jgi:hypothetical protein
MMRQAKQMGELLADLAVVAGGDVAGPYYAEAFAPMEGRCFRMVSRSREGGPIHCPERAAWRGSFRACDGRRYTVDACDGHRDPLMQARRL